MFQEYEQVEQTSGANYDCQYFVHRIFLNYPPQVLRPRHLDEVLDPSAPRFL